MHAIRKPRVFLSHSKKDVEFVRRLESDLRAAQCDTWIDEIELRSGQPWLDQIFGSGIPSCEIVLCYITANSLESEVFKREMDARLLERLHNARVSLLLYVASPDLRKQLRLDLQQLQMPELQVTNYANELPRVVAEIWRCYSESLVLTSIEAERVRRLEAELRVKELETYAITTLFTASENIEFTTIWSRLDRQVKVDAVVSHRAKTQTEIAGFDAEPVSLSSGQPTTHSCVVDVRTLFRLCVLRQKFQPSRYSVYERVQQDVLLHLGLSNADFEVKLNMPLAVLDVEAELLLYGFCERQYVPPPQGSQFRSMHDPFKLMFTAKFDRFGCWIEHNYDVNEQPTTVVKLQ